MFLLSCHSKARIKKNGMTGEIRMKELRMTKLRARKLSFAVAWLSPPTDDRTASIIARLASAASYSNPSRVNAAKSID